MSVDWDILVTIHKMYSRIELSSIVRAETLIILSQDNTKFLLVALAILHTEICTKGKCRRTYKTKKCQRWYFVELFSQWPRAIRQFEIWKYLEYFKASLYDLKIERMRLKSCWLCITHIRFVVLYILFTMIYQIYD